MTIIFGTNCSGKGRGLSLKTGRWSAELSLYLQNTPTKGGGNATLHPPYLLSGVARGQKVVGATNFFKESENQKKKKKREDFKI